MRTSLASALLGLATLAASQTFSLTGPEDPEVTYSWNVPSSDSNGQGDIFFQIKGPTSKSWIGLGQGNQMDHSNIFVIYANKAGNNVTLSPRAGANQVEPQEDTSAKVELLSGSGISNGMMIANIKCTNCNSWSGGTMSYTSSSSSWIWATLTGDPVSSDDKNADIEQHDVMGTLPGVDLTKATGGSSANPFASASGTSSSSSSTTSSSSSSSSASAEEEAAEEAYYASLQKAINVRTAHGTIMGLAFLFFFPLGSIIMRLSTHPSTIWMHAGVQFFAYALAIAGMGMGIWVALQFSILNIYHPIIGLVVVCLLCFQPITGLLHHQYYVKNGRRSPTSYIHMWWGRALMLLGAINGGLGLGLAAGAGGPTRGGIIAWGVLAGIVYVGYAAVVALTAGRKRKTGEGDKELGSVDRRYGVEN